VVWKETGTISLTACRNILQKISLKSSIYKLVVGANPNHISYDVSTNQTLKIHTQSNTNLKIWHVQKGTIHKNRILRRHSPKQPQSCQII